jgi:hypothetical protein
MNERITPNAPGGGPNECNNPRAKSNMSPARMGEGSGMGDVRGENVKFTRQQAAFCALRSQFELILRRNRLKISEFQKNFTNRIFSR